MKNAKLLTATLLATAAATALSACDAVWTAEAGGPAPVYYGTGVSTDWYPPLPGAPLLSPVYWGNQLYPGGMLPPIHRPINPVVPPTRPGSSAGGNVRPSGSPTPLPDAIPVPSGDYTPSVVPPAGTIRPGQVTGGEPGIAMPPAGSGYRPTRK